MTFHKYLADSKMFEYDQHYRECSQQNKPFIKSKINPVHGNYSINIDLLTCKHIFSKSEQNEIKKLIEEEILFVNSTCKNPFNDYTIDNDLVWIDGVSSEHMDTICTTLYDLIQKYIS